MTPSSNAAPASHDPHDPSRTFPRRQAITRGFRLGAPRSFTLSPDGQRVVFLRSSSSEDPANSLWVLAVDSGVESCVLDVRGHDTAAEDLTPEERARRERVRETAGGVVSYSTNHDVTLAVVNVGSRTLLVDLRSGRSEELPLGPGVVDPRLDPTGRRVAFVRDRGLWVHDVTGLASSAPVRLTPIESSPDVTWGLADFVAAEEMGRTRGFWWSPSGHALLAARVDESEVSQWWIADPAHPSRSPVPQRYPAAGSTNARTELALIDLTGQTRTVEWDTTSFEYLTSAGWDDHGPWCQVQDRAQTHLRLLTISEDGSSTSAGDTTENPWVELVDGVPARTPEGRWVSVADDAATDTRRVRLDDQWLSPPGLQVSAVLDVDDAGIVAAVRPVGPGTDPATQHVVRLAFEGAVTVLSPTDGWSMARASGDTTLLVSQALSTTASTVTVTRAHGSPLTIGTLAEQPGVEPRPHLITPAGSGTRVAVLFPAGDPGSKPLPVLMDPYGGPHGQRVVAAASAFTTAQWWADQGFAVVVADGRGMPGTPSWEKSVHGDLAAGVLEDQVAALQVAADAFPGRLDLTRVGIRGWSFGGYLAALAVMDRPDVFAAAIAGAPVTDWRLYDTHYTERYLGRPGSTSSIQGRTGDEVYDASSLLTRAAQLTRPLMLIHGLADDNVVAAHTLQLSSALLAAGRAHEVLPLSGVTHMTPQEDVAENLLRLQLDFLRRALG